MTFEKIIVLDFETTGISSDKRAVEIAWFELDRSFEIVDEQSSLINPEIPIPKRASSVHGIYDHDVRDQPTLDEFIIKLNRNPFIEEKVCVVAHNLAFDLPLFQKYCGGVIELCTVKLARAIYPDLQNHKLETISQTFGFRNENAHRARSDALQIVHFLTMIKSAHDMDIDAMIALASRGQHYRHQNGYRNANKKLKPAAQSIQCTECFLFVNKGLRACPMDDPSCPSFRESNLS